MKTTRTFNPARGLDDTDNLGLLRGDLNRLLAEYADSDFSLTVGSIRYDRDGENATIKVAIALKVNGVTITREVTSYERHAGRLGVNTPIGVTVGIAGVGVGEFTGHNRRATRYPFLFKVFDPQGNRTKAGTTYKLTVDQARSGEEVAV